MRIIVCIKQVPGSSNVKIDPNTGTLIRDGKNAKMNPYDLFSIEEALRIKEKTNAVVTAITMGPPSSQQVLKEALWMGCDNAYLISDRKFGGADVLATSFTIGEAIKKIGDYDLVFCGKQTTDGDTAQVGSEIAEHLGLPFVTYVTKIKEVKESSIVVESSLDQVIQDVEVAYPALISIDSNHVTPRLPSYRLVKKTENDVIPTITFMDMLDQDESHYGLKGSATQVEKMFAPEANKRHQVFTGSVDDAASEMVKILADKKFL
jgi:electron transfer flavoprotein beta subunit